MNIYQKLQKARIRLQGMELKKSGHNKFSGYYYFELGDFLPQTQTIFAEIGLCGLVSFTADLATLRIVNDEDEKEVVFTSPMGSAALKGCHEVQNIGAVETYQRRYLWLTAMEIVEHDAIDSAEQESRPAEKPAAKKAVKPSLKDDDLDDVKLAMRESTNLDDLKSVFGPAYKKANPEQQADLKKAYDKLKAELTEEESA